MPIRGWFHAPAVAVAALTSLAACGDEAQTIVDARPPADARTDGPADAMIDAPDVDAMIDAATIDSFIPDGAIIDGAVIDGAVIDAAITDAPAIDAAVPIDAALPVDGPPADAVVPPDGTIAIDALPAPAPSITAVEPNDGLYNATTAVRITGTNLIAGTTASFRGVPASCVNQSSTAMICDVPPLGMTDRGDVVVSHPGGSDTLVQGWTWTGVLNETNLAGEADYCNLQFPATMTVVAGGLAPTAYGRLYEMGRTEPAGQPAVALAELGFGPPGTNPTVVSWPFFDATYNVQVGNDDEFMRQLTAPTFPGTYSYTFRMSLDGGLLWTYCDLDGAGSNPGLTFSTTQLGTMTVTPPAS